MNRLVGPFIMATAVLHAGVALALFPTPLAAILHDGVFGAIHPPAGAIEPQLDRFAAFLFLLYAPVLFMLGQITNRAVERGEARILKVIGYNLLVGGALFAAIIPISGGWLLIGLAMLSLNVARRVEASPASLAYQAGTS